MLTERSPLLPEEAKLFSDREALDEAMRGRGFNLRGRVVSGRSLARLKIHNTTWNDVDFTGGELLACTVGSAAFNGVVFDEVTFRDVELHGVIFARCTFRDCQMEDVRFLECVFRRCRFETVRHSATVLEGCKLEDHEDTDGAWDQPRVERTSFLRATLVRTRMERGLVDTVEVRAGSVAELRMSDMTVKKVRFRELEVGMIELDHTMVDGLAFEQVSGKNIRLSDAKIDDLSLRGCEGLYELSAVASRIRGLRIEDCADVASFPLLKCQIERLAILRSTVSLVSARESQITGPSEVKSSTLLGVTLKACRIERLTIEDCEIGDSVNLTHATFAGLAHAGVRYQPDTRFVDDGVTYEDCPPLPRPE
jgi:uncharacterized protein YjbI with pentapeptide repeats